MISINYKNISLHNISTTDGPFSSFVVTLWVMGVRMKISARPEVPKPVLSLPKGKTALPVHASTPPSDHMVDLTIPELLDSGIGFTNPGQFLPYGLRIPQFLNPSIP
jgi:hypothetical protein